MTYSDTELDIRAQFPMLDDNKTYLDSASTSFTPQCVIKAINDYFNNHQSNYNRGANDLVYNITNRVNSVRKKVAEFIHAEENEIFFTSGATQGSQMIIDNFALNELGNGDEVLLCKMDHSSTINPWIKLKETLFNRDVNIAIKDILIDIQGDYNEEDLLSKVNSNTKYIILTHIHNVFGLEMGIKELVADIRKINQDVKVVLDASQSIGHIGVYVDDLDVDFLYFSGHKMFAPTGIGVLYVKNCRCENIELGTPNILGIIGLGAAIDFINEIGLDKIESHIYMLTRYLYEQLVDIREIEFNKGLAMCKCALGYGILSFKHNKYSSEDINEVLNYYKIYVRANHFCQEGQDDYIRVSLNIYNNKNDIDRLIKVIKSLE